MQNLKNIFARKNFIYKNLDLQILKTKLMKNLFAIISLLLIATNAWSQSTIALWNYDGITGTPATPVANVGSGTSLKIGSLLLQQLLQEWIQF